MNNEYPLKKVAFFILFFIVLIAIPLTVYLAQRQQSTQSKATVVPESVVVVVIDGGQITKAEVRKVAEENYSPETVDSQALKDALEILTERKILDKAAKDLGLKVDQDKAENLLEQEFSNQDARYEALIDQVILKAVKSRGAISIAFWNPPANSLSSLTAEERTAVAKQLTDGNAALIEAENRINAGEDVFEIGDALLTKYPSLKEVFAVNGYILSTLDSSGEIASEPRIYEFGDSGLDQATLDALFAMDVDGVKSITNTETNQGGVVFKLVSKGEDSGPSTYDKWLTAQKSLLVRDLGVL